MIKRTETKLLHVGSLQLGHQNKILIQSMTNTKTKNVEETIKQINELVKAGCEIVRLAIFDLDDAKAIKEIKKRTSIPLVADIHFDYKLALICAENGIDKIRINPGNIGKEENIKKVADICKEKRIPIRIGVNTGSLEKELIDKYGGPTSDAMIESAKKHIALLNKYNFDDICLSFKSSDVLLTIETYKKAAETFNYPLHLGVTEAGTYNISAIKSSAALGSLISLGIGDTIRVSVSSDPIEELKICKQLLKCFNLIDNVPNLISCPTCGRIQYDMLPIADKIEKYLNTINSNITVAIMGCAVNGPQEASRADIGIAGGKNEVLLFKKGQIVKKIPQDKIYEELIKEIDEFVQKEKDK